MNCKQVQEIIITDYIDSQIGDKSKRVIDQHLAHCHACKDFLISIKNEAVAPFRNARKAVPDEFLWARIKQTIEAEQEKQLDKYFIPDLWERFRSALHFPRPAFALATLVTMILMIGTTGQFFFQSMFVKINGQEQMEYISTLIDEPSDVAGNIGNNPPTPLEKYFL
jgi:anti-sigma factor RsiW